MYVAVESTRDKMGLMKIAHQPKMPARKGTMRFSTASRRRARGLMIECGLGTIVNVQEVTVIERRSQ